ncbi:RING-type E3 ubiquitin transferase [Quillaja saponaria]|uniref:RING-type E3 ubiquitin transferase n=1 Tax=Quillaja saponaria TaxID=32244 RepID=A0AAD7QB32_QUISA|nr:RING-type E3 ubiquitin transferase [Quillaja saponaria]
MTYDRPFIQRWLNEGHRTCPQTQQVLSHTILTPNHLVRDMISQWFKEHGIEIPKPVRDIDEEVITNADRHCLNSLLQKLSLSVSDQKEAAKELRLLTKRMPSFRTLFGVSGDVIPQLLNPLSAGNADIHPDLKEDLITTVLNFSIQDNNKKIIAENPLVIPLLIDSLQSGTIQTRSNAAAAIFTLSALDSNKHIIGESGAFKHLINLLDEGHLLVIKDVASAIFNLCIVPVNRGRAIQEGAVGVILKKVMDSILVDELLAILALLSSHPNAVEDMAEIGALPCLLEIIRESTSERTKENCVAIVHTIYFYDRNTWREIREEEKANSTLSKLAQSGTSRAKRKVNGILDRLSKGPSLTHTA